MVLENASGNQVTDAFSENTPASDDDPYSNSSSSASSYNIDRTNFPKPIPIIGSVFGYNDKLFSKVLQAKIQNGANTIHRPLTPEEASSMAYWTAKQVSILSYGAPLGVAAGWWRCYGTKDIFRFPFFQPNLEKFNTEAWPSPRMAALRGNRAVVAWHALRLLSYGAVGNFFGQMFFGSYSMSVAAVGEMSDPRLKAFVDAVRNQAQQKRGGLPNAMGGRAGQGQTSRQQGGDTTVQMEGKQLDDASPTGGMFFDEVAEDGKTTGNGNGGVQDNTQSGRPQGQRRQWPQAKPAQRKQESQEAKPLDIFDDVSPTDEQGTAANIQSSQALPGSTWDRIRRGESSPSTPQKSGSSWPSQGNQPQPTQGGWARKQSETQSGSEDSFTFSKAEGDKSYAKVEAQKEFDARIERERTGGNFSQGGGDQKRW